MKLYYNINISKRISAKWFYSVKANWRHSCINGIVSNGSTLFHQKYRHNAWHENDSISSNSLSISHCSMLSLILWNKFHSELWRRICAEESDENKWTVNPTGCVLFFSIDSLPCAIVYLIFVSSNFRWNIHSNRKQHPSVWSRISLSSWVCMCFGYLAIEGGSMHWIES